MFFIVEVVIVDQMSVFGIGSVEYVLASEQFSQNRHVGRMDESSLQYRPYDRGTPARRKGEMGHLLCLRGAGRPVGAPKGARRLSWKRFQMLEKSYTLPWCLQGAALPLADHRRAEAPRRGDEAAPRSPPRGSVSTVTVTKESRVTTKMILDCDPGHDDAIAILLALGSPQIDLLGITTIGGNHSLEKVTFNARAVCELAGRHFSDVSYSFSSIFYRYA